MTTELDSNTDDFNDCVDHLDDKCVEVFSNVIERVKNEIDDQQADFLFALLDNPRMLKWFDDGTQTLVHSYVRLTEIRNSLEEVCWDMFEHVRSEEKEEEVRVNPFDHPEEECLFVATPQDEEREGTLTYTRK